MYTSFLNTNNTDFRITGIVVEVIKATTIVKFAHVSIQTQPCVQRIREVVVLHRGLVMVFVMMIITIVLAIGIMETVVGKMANNCNILTVRIVNAVTPLLYLNTSWLSHLEHYRNRSMFTIFR